MERRQFLVGLAGIFATGYAPLVGANLVRDGLIMRVKPIILQPWQVYEWIDMTDEAGHAIKIRGLIRPDCDWIKVTGIWDTGQGAGWYRSDGSETTNYLESRQFTSHRQQRNP